jgi:hypothetical protein
MRDSALRSILGDQVDVLAKKAADDLLRVAKKNVTNRKAVVAVFAYAMRAALDDLSPDERAAWLEIAVSEIQGARP